MAWSGPVRARVTVGALCVACSRGGEGQGGGPATSADGGALDGGGGGAPGDGGDRADAVAPRLDAGAGGDAGAGAEGGASSPPGTGSPIPGISAPAEPVVRQPSCGATTTTLLGRVDVAAMVADDAHVYYADRGPGSCYKNCRYDGGPVSRVGLCDGTPEILLPGLEYVHAVVDGGSVVYVVRETTQFSWSGIARIDKQTRAVTELPARCVRAAAANASGFYYFDPCAASPGLYRIAHGATTAVRLAATGPDVVAVAATAEDVYFGGTTPMVPNSGVTDSISRYHVADGSISTVATLPGHLTGIAATSQGVYATYGWLVNNAGFDTLFTGPVWQVSPGTPGPLGPDELTGTLSLHGDTVYLNGTNGFQSLAGAVAGERPLTRSHPAVARNGLVYFTEGGLLLARPATPLPPDPPLSAPEPGVRRLTQPSGDGFSIWNAVALGSRGFAVLGRAFSAGTLPGARPIPPDTVVVATYTREGTLGASVQEPLGGFLSPPPWILASPDGSRLDMANGGVLTRYDATLESPLLRAPFPYPALAVSAAGELLVSGANSPPAPAPTLDGFSPSASLAWSWPLSGGVTIVAAAFGAGGDAVAAGAFPDPTAPMYSQPVSRPRSGFVGAFPRTGAPAWLRPLPGVLPEALVTDPAGNAYLAATSAGAFDVGRGPEVVPQPGVSAVILAKYAPDGSVTWVRLFPRCASPQLAIAANGTLAIAVRGDLDPSGTAPEGSISPTVSIGVLAADGTPTWVEHAGDTWPQGLSVYPDGHTLTVEGLPDGAGAVVERGPQ